ncbi:MAG: 3-hydroxy-5-phosphonooxypentane-2,4-dione thiolase [bacterium]
MDWGMKNRMSNIIQPDSGRCLMLAVDHGYFLGPTSGLEKMDENIDPLVPYADALMLNRGALRNWISPDHNTPVILRASGGTSVLTDLSNEGLTLSMEEVMRLNASMVAVSIFVGADYERQTLLGISELINQAEDLGIPVLCVTAVGKDMARDARYLSLASRIGAELGARMIKTYYCKDFKKVVNSCPVPVVIAGGKKIPEKDALQMAYRAVSDGAVGVDMGRNIFQSEDPIAMIKAVRAILHENYGPGKAHNLYLDEKKKNKSRKSKKSTSSKKSSSKK